MTDFSVKPADSDLDNSARHIQSYGGLAVQHKLIIQNLNLTL